MIAVDTSALVAIAKNEPEQEAFTELIGARTAIVGTTILFETRLVLHALLDGGADRYVEDIIANPAVRIVDFTVEHYRLAGAALQKYGRGQGHPAKLNFGDCLSYAVAKRADCPLLYKGDDFTHTDIRPAYFP